MSEPVKIDLTARGLISTCEDIARKRQRQAIERNRKPGNNLKASLREQLAHHMIGAKTECANNQWLLDMGLEPTWHDYRDDYILSNTPDIEIGGVKIDVKGTPHANGRLLVQAGKVKTHWAYVLATTGDRPGVYFLHGWEWGHHAYYAPVTSPQPGRPAHTIEAGDLRDMEELATVCLREARAAWMRERMVDSCLQEAANGV